MKKTLLLSIIFFSIFSAQAQVTSLNENFNASCPANNTFSSFSRYNSPYSLALAWDCTLLGGRASTPGVECVNFISGIKYEDTAWFFTPQLLLSGYQHSIFLRFDSRYEQMAARLSILVSTNYVKNQDPDSVGNWADITSSMIPAIDPGNDSGMWVTRSVDLTAFKSTPLYVAFRFIGTTAIGGRWTLDNINTSESPLSIIDISDRKLGLTILGNSTSGKITFSCTGVVRSGGYEAVVYDNMGREVHKEKLELNAGTGSYTLNNLELRPGMYLLKVASGTEYGVVKTVVE